ncbi:MAG TPA: hypothetical protein VH438_10270 [Gemmatimonadales bacterium]
MSPHAATRGVLLGHLMLVAALSGMLVQQRWAHPDSKPTIVADRADRQVTLRDSLMNLPGPVTEDSVLIRKAASPVRLVGPTLIAWDDPGALGDARSAILLHPPVVEALRKVAEDEGFTLEIRSTRQLRIVTSDGNFSASHAEEERNESFVLAAPGSQSELHFGLMSPEELRDALRHFRRTYRS